jgi:hypothetical protein
MACPIAPVAPNTATEKLAGVSITSAPKGKPGGFSP